MERIYLGGYPIFYGSEDSAYQCALSALAERGQLRIFFANTNFIVKCQDVRSKMIEENVLILNDGIGIDMASLFVNGKRFLSNLNGTDFIPGLFSRSVPLKVFLIGGRPGIAEAAGRFVESHYGHKVVGVCDGYAELENRNEVIVREINESEADVVLVAMGNPVQERWILDHSKELVAPLIFGVGALFDFMTGGAKRAPQWIRNMHLEWLFRLTQEPKRLFRRYTTDIFVFLSICVLERARSR